MPTGPIADHSNDLTRNPLRTSRVERAKSTIVDSLNPLNFGN